MEIFRDRRDAGQKLARLVVRPDGETPVILALPRGGVPVGAEVARALGAPLDVLVVRKLGAPFQPELGVGAVGEGGALVVDEWIRTAAGLDDEELAALVGREEAEVERRVARYRGGRPLPDLEGRVVVIVDDGIATGGTVRAAVRAARARGARRVVVAAPVAARDAAAALHAEVDELVCVATPAELWAIGNFYEDFHQVTDDEVIATLDHARAELAAAAPSPLEEPVALRAGGAILEGNLAVPDGAAGLVIFAHGGGSSRHSPRNRFVASALRRAGLGTLLLDLLTEDEEAEDALRGELRFDVSFLAARLSSTIDWTAQDPRTRRLHLGLFGASTGAAAALAAAAVRAETIAAVVSRGGRPDLAGALLLRRVYAPTLLVVGGEDPDVLELNRRALPLLRGEKELIVVPGASHLFEEPGALDEVAMVAARWFVRYLAPRGVEARP